MTIANLPRGAAIKNGDELRNINSFEYLHHIADAIPTLLHTTTPFREVKALCGGNAIYHSDIAYGDLYQKFLLNLENNLEGISYRADPVEMAEMIRRIYANPNQALERSAKMVQEALSLASQTSKEVETAVRRRLIGNRKGFGKFMDKLNHTLALGNVNQITPQGSGSNLARLTALVSSTYKPQTTTSMVSIRKYNYQQADAPTEYRFGTQGQYHHRKARVSPLFEKLLDIQAADNSGKITHVYFNNLGLDRTNYEGKREKQLTEKLHQLEAKHPNIVVITLPADKGMMDVRLLKRHRKNMTPTAATEVMYRIASGKRKEGINDFYISPRAKELLYGKNNENEEKILRELIAKSFAKFGLSDQRYLSEAQLNAVYFHFVKYEFTDYCLKTLKPKGFNISCKDGIDRAGVASAYYNLIKSLELGKPFTREEFERALHAAPTLVKGRGMNHHIKLIWNAVDTYIYAQDTVPRGNVIPDWLREWRDKNVLPCTRQFYTLSLERYIDARNKEPEYLSDFAKDLGLSKGVKIATATKLLNLLNGKTDVIFSHQEAVALADSRLGKIYKALDKQKLITPIKVTESLGIDVTKLPPLKSGVAIEEIPPATEPVSTNYIRVR